MSVFGLGYVGAVSCGCLANDGHEVIGVDLNPVKVAMLNEGRSPVVEERIGDLIANSVAKGRLRATEDVREAVHQSDVSIVSVGTPAAPNGCLSLTAVERVSEQIGAAMADLSRRHLVVIRSTVLPGSTRDIVVPALERTSGRRLGEGFGVCFNPEFLREGSSVADHYSPPFTLIGAWDERDSQAAADIFHAVDAPVFHTDVEAAEMVKYVCNAFHALKTAFANEVGSVARPLGIDSHLVMDLVGRDTKLNISTKYLTPGFAFGGSCLPKDVRALASRARELDVAVPVIDALMTSNRALIDRTIGDILALKRRRVTLLGLSFKAGTDDLRESPLVVVAETLLGKGIDLQIYDEAVSVARLVGANKEYIDREIPHLSALLRSDLAEAVAHGEVVVVGNNAPGFREVPRHLTAGQIVVDLVRIPEIEACKGIDYRGVAW